MTKKEIIAKIQTAEEIAEKSKKFPETAFKVILNFLLSGNKIKVDKKTETIGVLTAVKTVPIGKNSNKGLSKKINDLIDDGFFRESKTSKEIISKLKLLGYTMKVTSLPSYLLPKIRSGELVREEIETKNGKVYGYIYKN